MGTKLKQITYNKLRLEDAIPNFMEWITTKNWN